MAKCGYCGKDPCKCWDSLPEELGGQGEIIAEGVWTDGFNDIIWYEGADGNIHNADNTQDNRELARRGLLPGQN